MLTLQDLKIAVHHTLQNVIKIIVPKEAAHVILRSRPEAEKWM